MKINNEIEIKSFVTIECPYCYNMRDIQNVDDFRIDDGGRVSIYCDNCMNPMYLEIVIPFYNKEALGLDSQNIRIEDKK